MTIITVHLEVSRGILWLRRTEPVSYTHLDVYKRQIYLLFKFYLAFYRKYVKIKNKNIQPKRIIIRCCLKKVKKMAAVDILSDARRKKDERSKAVSYTHLDVYKRQTKYNSSFHWYREY